MTQAFCGACTRARLSADGELYTCLFSASGHDLRSALRNGSSDAEIAGLLTTVWSGRDDRYSAIRGEDTIGIAKVEMSRIGG